MIVTPSTRAKSAGVEIGKSGLQAATKKRGAGLRTVSFSPRPSASCVPPRMQKGTSLPTLALICSSRSSVRVGETSSRSARSTAAASRAAGHAGLGRNALYKRDVDAAAVVHRLAKGSRRLDSEVALIAGKRRAVDAAGDAFAVCERDGHIVVERNGRMTICISW